jgi:hypothetical protein
VSGTDGRDLAALPKGHLHLHMEAAMRPGTLAELAAEHGVPVPAIAAVSLEASGASPELIGQGLAAIREWLDVGS